MLSQVNWKAFNEHSEGFRVGVLSLLSTKYVAKNLQSALAEPEIVSALLAKEVHKKYVIGPFIGSSLFSVSILSASLLRDSQGKNV